MPYPKPFPLHKCCFLVNKVDRCSKKSVCVVSQNKRSPSGRKDFPLCRTHLEWNNTEQNNSASQVKFFDKVEASLFILDGCIIPDARISYFRGVKEQKDVKQLGKTLASTGH